MEDNASIEIGGPHELSESTSDVSVHELLRIDATPSQVLLVDAVVVRQAV